MELKPMMLHAPEEGTVPGYWCTSTQRWIPTQRKEYSCDGRLAKWIDYPGKTFVVDDFGNYIFLDEKAILSQTYYRRPFSLGNKMIDLPKTTPDYKPPEVSALEYLRGVSRALKQAGLTVNVGHIDTAVNKLVNEQEIPKVRLLQILNKMQEAVDKEQKEITLSIDELRAILSSNRFKE